MTTPELIALVNRFLDHYHPGDPQARNDLLVIVGASMEVGGNDAAAATREVFVEPVRGR